VVLKLDSEIWTNSKGKRFVVLPEDQFVRFSELLEDAGLSRILREANKADAGGPGIPLAEAKRQLAARDRAKAKPTRNRRR